MRPQPFVQPRAWTTPGSTTTARFDKSRSISTIRSIPERSRTIRAPDRPQPRQARPGAPGRHRNAFGGGQFHHHETSAVERGRHYVVGRAPHLGGVGGVAEPLGGGGGGSIADDIAELLDDIHGRPHIRENCGAEGRAESEEDFRSGGYNRVSMGRTIRQSAGIQPIPIEIHRKLFRVLLISEPWRCRVGRSGEDP